MKLGTLWQELNFNITWTRRWQITFSHRDTNTSDNLARNYIKSALYWHLAIRICQANQTNCIGALVSKIIDVNSSGNNAPSMIYRLWKLRPNREWTVDYYSQEFLKFSKKIKLARRDNYCTGWAIERVSDSILVAFVTGIQLKTQAEIIANRR